MPEKLPSPEYAKRVHWTDELTGFLAESYRHGWAASAPKEKDPITGEKTLVYERGDWRYIDKYTGYFAAPGESKVYYKGRHVWSMFYGGTGQEEQHFDKVKETYDFLKQALGAAEPELPLRGPESYKSEDGHLLYEFTLDGDLLNGVWHEEIYLYPDIDQADVQQLFRQDGLCGIIIEKDADYQPVWPWDL